MKNYLSTFYVLIIMVFGTQLYGQKITNLQPKDHFTYTEHTARVIHSEDTNFLESGDTNSKASPLINPVGNITSEAGETPGALSVSLTGAANYAVPIAVPPGIDGVSPAIAVSYNSQAGNGLIGWGWNLSGTSTITRIPSTKYHDGVKDPVDFDNLDRFALDGQRLVLKSGTYGTNGAEYQTENYSNLKITSVGTSPYGAAYGPSYFIVKYPDGSTAYYGSRTSTRSRLEYALTYKENPQGIRITYNYVTSGNVLRVTQIAYGSKGSASPINTINFSYGARRYKPKAYINGQLFKTEFRLQEINVIANGAGYRTYKLKHNWDGFGYDRLKSIQEFSGDKTVSLNPISFDYYADGGATPSHNVITTNLGLNNIESRNSETRSLDLTGNGKMDFLVFPNTKDTFYLFKDDNHTRPYTVNTGKFENILPVTFLNHQNKILAGQGLAVIQHDIANSKVKFKVYANGISRPLYYQYEKVWTPPVYTTATGCNRPDEERVRPQEYLSGDFNGDGLSDVIAISKEFTREICRYINGRCICSNVPVNSPSFVNFIDLDRRKTTGFTTASGQLQKNLISGDRLKTADVNGDGRTDILHFTASKVYAYTLSNNNTLSILWETSSSYIKNDFPVLLGDYNGDGKMDFMTPKANNSKIFYVFTSTGKSFISKSINFPIWYSTGTWDGNKLINYSFIPLDINSDGKTDIIRYRTETFNGNSNGKQDVATYININPLGTDDFRFKWLSNRPVTGNVKHYPVPIFLSSDNPNRQIEFATISDNKLHTFNSKQHHKTSMTLKGISNNDVNYVINYSNLDPNDTANGVVYSTSTDQVYPYVNIAYSSNVKLVHSIERHVENTSTLKRLFYYKNAISHLEGLGFQGFEFLARSNWHTGGTDRIFTNTTHSIPLRGAIIDEYQTPYTERFGVIPSDYIYKTKNTYEHSLSSNKVLKLTMTRSTNENRLDGTVTTSHYDYDTYNNPTRATVNHSGHGSTTTTIDYSNSTGSDYYIGRKVMESVTSTIGSDSFRIENRYSYNGALVSSVRITGNGTKPNTTSYSYDTYGNVTAVLETPFGDNAGRIERFEYDPSGRFIMKATNISGLETIYTYDDKTGNLLSETNSYNQTTNYQYDKWFRPVKTIDFLSNQNTSSYAKSGSNYVITANGADGSASSTEMDPLQRLIKTRSKTRSGQWSQITTEYDKFDRIARESEPHFGSGASQWNTTTYDFYGRVKTQTTYTGKTSNYTYSGLSVTVDDGTKTTTTTTDAMGNVVRVDDPGGSIRYTYFGNGNLKTVSYQGTTQTIQQDGWGRKTKLIDPSAGTYTYEYNGFGEVTKEVTPKGTTTYLYESDGRIRQTKIVGDNTNMITNYSYDNTTLFLKNITASDQVNSKNYRYDYSYDSHKRPYRINENNGSAYYSKTYTYDSFSRVSKEYYTAKIRGKASTSSLTYDYNAHGAFTGFENWKINSSNARGQITQISLGTGHTEDRRYDTYGFLSSLKVANYSNRELFIENTYKFNPQRGTLTERSHGSKLGDDWKEYNESFTYDNQDRLRNISGPFAKTTNFDNLGRITSNSKIGSFTYQSGSKKFQLKEITTNTAGENFFNNRTRQHITYNAFKKPVKIFEDGGRGIVDFEYGPMQNRREAWYGDSQLNKNNRRFHKQYSSIIPAEIIEDKRDNSIKFIFYNGGDAYSAPIAKIEKINAFGASDGGAIYHLQRDYLGSILNITKQTGNGSNANGVLQERRQFGAWGTVDAYWSVNGGEMGHESILDRGYTGHEHFTEVGLIHMNGRMYDPHIGRFLSPDNYVQNPYNSQNFNRYGYVLNNPLMYNDPTGEMTEYDSGWNDAYGSILGGLVGTVVTNWDNWGIKDWANNAFSNFGSDLGDLIDSKWDIITGLFGGSSEPKIIEMSQTYVNSDPLIAPSPSIGSAFMSNGGGSSFNPDPMDITNQVLRGNLSSSQNNESTNASGISDDSWLRYIPIVGSGIDAYDSFSRGDIWTGIGHSLLAISDVFLVKSIFTGIGKAVIRKGLLGGTKRFFGVGMSHNYGATVSRLKRLGVNMSGYKHHWLITQKMMQNSQLLKTLGNQTWNLTRFGTQASHMRWAHGAAYPSLGLAKIPGAKYLYPLTSTPLWFRLGLTPYIAKNVSR